MDFWGSWKPIELGKCFEPLSLDSIGESLRAASGSGIGAALQDQIFPVQSLCFDSMATAFSGVGSLTSQLANIETYSTWVDDFTWQAMPIKLTPPESIFSSWRQCELLFTSSCKDLGGSIGEPLSFNFEAIALDLLPGFGKTMSLTQLISMPDFSDLTELHKHRKILDRRTLYLWRRLLFGRWRYWSRPVARDEYRAKHFSLGEKKRPTRKLAPSARAMWVPDAVSKVKHGFRSSRRGASEEDDASISKRVNGTVERPAVMHLAFNRGSDLAPLAA
jgi:hypothetical protein